MSSCRRLGWAVVASTVFAPALGFALPPDDGGGLVGWVESTHGVPVAGALVSIFGKGIRGGSLVTLADSQGQFVLPSLPAGILHAARGEPGARALGGPARDRAPEPRRALDAEPRAAR